MNSRVDFHRLGIGLFATIVLAGCSSGAGGDSTASTRNGARILHAGGQGDDVTATFTTKASGITVAYQLAQASSRDSVTVSIEQDSGNGTFSPVSTLSRPASETRGSAAFPLIPGTYRVRVGTDIAWSADIFESKP